MKMCYVRQSKLLFWVSSYCNMRIDVKKKSPFKKKMQWNFDAVVKGNKSVNDLSINNYTKTFFQILQL